MPPHEAVAHHELAARAQCFDEALQVREVVAVVGVAHDDVAAAGGRDARHQRRAVAALVHVHHACALGFGNLDRAVRRAVVGDDDFARDAVQRHVAPRLADARR